MSSAPRLEGISVADYLAGEEASTTKYEYVDGRVYAMAGARNLHNRIASRVLGSLYTQLSLSGCEAYNSDTKVRIRRHKQTYFYYPDAMVVCESNADDDTFQDCPVLIVEVVSESTRRIDEGEKREHYCSIDTLQAYVLLEQERMAARAYVRNETKQFIESIYDGPEAVIHFPTLNLVLALSKLYAATDEPGLN